MTLTCTDEVFGTRTLIGVICNPVDRLSAHELSLAVGLDSYTRCSVSDVFDALGRGRADERHLTSGGSQGALRRLSLAVGVA